MQDPVTATGYVSTWEGPADGKPISLVIELQEDTRLGVSAMTLRLRDDVSLEAAEQLAEQIRRSTTRDVMFHLGSVQGDRPAG